MAFADFKQGQISYSEEGKGNAVVLLHGFMENKSMWKDFSKELSKSNRVISIDLPGHGESSNFGYCHTMELMADAVIQVLKTLKIRRYYLVGHSMGGYVSMAIAEKHADNIKGLCMFHSTADSDSDQKKKDRNKVIKVVQKDKEIFIRESIPNLFNTKHKPYKRAINQVSKMARQMSSQSIIAALEGMKIRVNREIVVKFAPYPVLYIIGDKDNVLDADKLKKESNLSENSNHLLLTNSGHMAFIEDKEVCLKALKKFVKSKLD